MTEGDEHVEHRIRELFAVIDASAVPRPLRLSSRDRAPSKRLALAVLCLVVVAGVALVVRSQRVDQVAVRTVSSPAASSEPAAFNKAASALCVSLDQDRNGVAPRFATAEAYVAVVHRTRATVQTFLDSFSRLAPPSDDPGLATAVIADLRAVRAALDAIEESALGGDLDDAAVRWASIDGAIAASMRRLGHHGAAQC